MKHFFPLLAVVLFFLLGPGICQGQTKSTLVTGTFQNMPLKKALAEIEASTPYTFFYIPAQVDSVVVNAQVKEQPLEQVLGLFFKNTDLQFTISPEKEVFLLKGQQINAALPPGLFPDKTPNSVSGRTPAKSSVTPSVAEPRAATVATHENKVYEVGVRSSASSEGRATISGQVLNTVTREPLVGAAVFTAETNTGATTDQNGYFSFSLPKGRHTIKVRSLGLKDTQRQIVLYSDGKLNIEMVAQSTNLKEVVVQAESNSNVRRVEMGIERLDISTIKQVPTVFGEADILKVVLTLPGVKSVGEASTGFNVRGGSADQNLILFNEATIYNPSHFFGFFSAFNPEIIKDVELYKSSIPARYGGRLSSVLNVNTRDGNKTKFTGSAGIGLLTSRINVEGPLIKEKTSFLFGARTTYSNWLFKLLPNDASYKNSKASFYDVNLNLHHKVNDKSSLALTTYLSQDESNLNTDTLFSYRNRNVSLQWRQDFSQKLFGAFTVGYDHYQYENYSDADPVTAYNLRFHLNQTNLKANFTYNLSDKHTLTFGGSSIYYDINPGTFTAKGAESLIQSAKIEDEKALESALYLEENFAVTPRLSLQVGLRYSFFNYLGSQEVTHYAPGLPKEDRNATGTTTYGSGEAIQTYHGPEYRASARFAITDKFSVKAGYSTLRQYLHMLSNTTAIAPTDIWKLSDPNIKPQFSEQLSFGLYQNLFSDKVEVSTEVYTRKIKNYLDYKSGAVLVMNPAVETEVLTTEGKAYGLEVMIKKPLGNFNGWLSYTYSRILLRQDDPTAGETINGGAYYPASYDKPHDFTFIGNQRITRRFSISMNVTYSTGRPVTIPIAKFYYGGSQKTLYSGRNDYRIPDYFRTDLSVNLEGNHKIKQLTHNSWTFGVYNLTGRKNPYSIYFTSENGLVKGYKLSVFGSAIPFVNFNIRF